MPVQHSPAKTAIRMKTPRLLSSRSKRVTSAIKSSKLKSINRRLNFSAPSGTQDKSPDSRTPLAVAGSRENNSPATSNASNNSWPPIHLPIQPSKTLKAISFAAYSDSPAEWFEILESDFASESITDETTKCRIARIGLSKHQPTLELIRDCLNVSNEVHPYATLKARVIKRLAHSEDAKWSKLQSPHQLGTKKPSHFLAELKLLAPADAPERLIRNTFLSALPPALCSQLDMQPHLRTLDEVAQMADVILEKYPSNYGQSLNTMSVAVQPTTPVNTPATCIEADDSSSSYNETLSAMKEQLETLAIHVKRISAPKPKEKISQTSRTEPGTRKRRPQPGDEDYLCWYHWKFGANSKKCAPFCCYSKTEQKN